jgi:polyphosphate kinase 2 (PPK2 family)
LWKVNPTDVKEREHWDEYCEAYEDVFRHCSTKHAPWHIIPATKKWYRNVAISAVLVETLQSLKMKYPKAEFDLSKMKME